MVQSIDDARRRQPPGAGRVPPHNLEAEESLLGAMLLSRDAIVAAVEAQVSADDFYKPAHGHVFDAITSLYGQGEPADPVTVAEELRRAGVLDPVGGPAALISLQARTPAIGNATRYASIVEEYALLRRLIAVAGDIAELGYSVPDDVLAAIDTAESLVFEVAQRRVTDTMLPIRELLERHLDHIEALYERGQDIIGVPTGYIDLDQQLAGLQPSNLIIVGGRPGTGKALSVDTPIATPTGWTTMGELTVGDQVFDDQGRPCRVSFATPVMRGRPCFEVCFDDGSALVADADHQWLASGRVVTTRQMVEEGGHWQVPLAMPLHCPGLGQERCPKSTDFRARTSVMALGALRAPVRDRMTLLQELIDTLGAVDRRTGVAALCGTDRSLLEHARELVCSLGYKPGPVEARAPTGWRLSWSLLEWGRHGRRAITAIRPVPSVPVRCITVDSPNRLYLAGRSMIPTHNTSFALGIAAHAALDAHTPVLVFSLEMSHLELTQRLLCSEARVDATRMRNGRLLDTDWPKISHAVGRLAEAPINIDDNPHLTVMEIRAKARRLKSRQGLGLIVIDYLQLMTGRQSAENRQVEVSEISRGLKILARELEVPVVALSQLSRNLETRAEKRPVLADLRESGCMPATTRLMRADDGSEVTLGELVLSQEQPLVWSLDDRWRIVPRRLLRAFPSGIKPVFRLRLRSGYEVEATANHPFRTISGWVQLKDLCVGDAIAVPRRLPAPLEHQTWDNNELVLLAHLLGDGSIGPSGVKYATADPANKAIVEETARRLFDITVTGKILGRTWQLWLPSPYHLTHGRRHPVRNWLEPLGLWGSRSHDKFIPEALFELSDGQIALFLRHLWATDGSITCSRNNRGNVVRIYYSSTSRGLVDGVRRLLLRLDVRSRVSRARKSGYRDWWHLTVTGVEDMTRFLTRVGCHGQRGETIPKAVAALATIRPNPNVDLVPWEIAHGV
ncbi:MAG TPA: replicative DNA helicase, partial [Acidimicrobiales bacterium]|nr:replicative DNA helicase [Acidimicrobiales bacterium]